MVSMWQSLNSPLVYVHIHIVGGKGPTFDTLHNGKQSYQVAPMESTPMSFIHNPTF